VSLENRELVFSPYSHKRLYDHTARGQLSSSDEKTLRMKTAWPVLGLGLQPPENCEK
jgi:hypothetical protein